MNGEVHLRLTNRALFLVLAALGLLWLARQATHILVVLFLAVLLSSAVSTAARRLERFRIGRGAAILLIYLLVAAVLAALVALVVPLIVGEAQLLQQNLPRYEAQANAALARLPARSGAPPRVDDLAGQLAGRLQAVAAGLSRGALTLGSTLVTTLLVFVIAYFLAADARFAERVVARFLPPASRARALTIMGRIGDGLGHWVRAQLLLALFFGVAFGLGLGLLGLPYALTLGAIGGMLEIIPYVGGFATIALAVLVAATTGQPWLIAATLGWYLVVVNVEAHIVAPKLVGEVVGLHPLVVVLALFLGAETLGIIGALLAVPLAVIAQTLLDEFWRFPDNADGTPSRERVPLPLQPGVGGGLAPLAATGVSRVHTLPFADRRPSLGARRPPHLAHPSRRARRRACRLRRATSRIGDGRGVAAVAWGVRFIHGRVGRRGGGNPDAGEPGASHAIHAGAARPAARLWRRHRLALAPGRRVRPAGAGRLRPAGARGGAPLDARDRYPLRALSLDDSDDRVHRRPLRRDL